MKISKNALVYVEYPQLYQKKLLNALTTAGYSVISVVPDNSEKNLNRALKALEYVEIAILGGVLPIQNLEHAPNLKWIHFDWVGIEKILTRAMFEGGRIITNGSGRNSICLAEHVFYFIFTLTYGTRDIFISQHDHHWGVNHLNPYSCLFNKTILIIGTGSIGTEVALRAKSFGMKTVGYSRTLKEHNSAYDRQESKQAGVDLASLITQADFIVLSVPLNTDTYHLIDASVFEKMKKTAYLINISRGAIVDEKALSEAVSTRQIAGAGCDTFENEPLDKSSPLWDLPTMVITPHSTPQSPLKFEQGIGVITENLKRLKNGEVLLNSQSCNDVLN